MHAFACATLGLRTRHRPEVPIPNSVSLPARAQKAPAFLTVTSDRIVGNRDVYLWCRSANSAATHCVLRRGHGCRPLSRCLGRSSAPVLRVPDISDCRRCREAADLSGDHRDAGSEGVHRGFLRVVNRPVARERVGTRSAMTTWSRDPPGSKALKTLHCFAWVCFATVGEASHLLTQKARRECNRTALLKDFGCGDRSGGFRCILGDFYCGAARFFLLPQA